jgi:hypothetical protein
MPKDASKNVDRYKIAGGHLNEFEFHQNQGQLKELEKPAQGATARKLMANKVATKTARAEATKKAAAEATKKAAAEATKKAATKATKKSAKKTATKKRATKKGATKKAAKKARKK